MRAASERIGGHVNAIDGKVLRRSHDTRLPVKGSGWFRSNGELRCVCPGSPPVRDRGSTHFRPAGWDGLHVYPTGLLYEDEPQPILVVGFSGLVKAGRVYAQHPGFVCERVLKV